MRYGTRILLFVVAVSLLAIGPVFGGDTPRMYVVNSLSENLSVIDMAKDAVVDTIPLGARGYMLSLLGDTAYITTTPGAQAAQGAQAQLLPVNLNSAQIGKGIPLALSPLATVHTSPQRNMAYVVTAAAPGARNDQRGQVLFVDLPRRKVTRTVPVGLNPLESVMTPDGARLFTVDWASHTISVLDLQAGRLLDTLPLGFNTTRVLAMRRDGKKLYTVLDPLPLQRNAVQQNIMNSAMNNQTNLSQQVEDSPLWEIDTATCAISKYPLPGVNQVSAIAVSPNGQYLYVYGRPPVTATAPVPTEYVLVLYDLKAKKTVRHFGNFGYLSALVVSDDGNKLYLIGTPGDPRLEAAVQEKFATRMNAGQRVQTSPTRSQVTATVQDLSQLNKTITVLDAATGAHLKTITIGSLPRGTAVKRK